MADDEDDTDDLEIEDEKDDAPYVEFDISVSPSDPTLELLSTKLTNEDIIIPVYQRKFVWSQEQSSKLIESFLLGLPVPQVFFYINDEDQLEVIDGQQRLMSVKYFLEGYFDEPDSTGKRQTFRLKGLSERSEYNGKMFTDLPKRDQRRLKNSTLRAINIKQISPKNSNDSVFHIFERLNTGGTRLKAQEIRNAVYRGEIVVALRALNKIPAWQKILGLKKPDKSQKDVELVLRLFSLFQNWAKYEKPMLGYLNKNMQENRKFDSAKASKFKIEFARTVKLVSDNLERPFRPARVINTAVLEAVMVTLMEHPSPKPAILKSRYEALLKDKDFTSLIRGATTDTLTLTKRLQAAKKIIFPS